MPALNQSSLPIVSPRFTFMSPCMFNKLSELSAKIYYASLETTELDPAKALCILGISCVHHLHDSVAARYHNSFYDRRESELGRGQIFVAMVVDFQHVNVHPLRFLRSRKFQKRPGIHLRQQPYFFFRHSRTMDDYSGRKKTPGKKRIA